MAASASGRWLMGAHWLRKNDRIPRRAFDDDDSKQRRHNNERVRILTAFFLLIGGLIYLVSWVFSLQHSQELKEIKAKGNWRAFDTAQKCLRRSQFAPWRRRQILEDESFMPSINLTEHFLELLKATEPFRNVPEWKNAGYSGPWIERRWIDRFCCDRPISDFGGLVPLFLQWNDLAQNTKDEWVNTTEFRNFYGKLRRDVLYVTVSQSAAGINPFRSWFGFQPRETWNILVINSGGYGHMPIPLLLKELDIVPLTPKPEYITSFAGSLYYWVPTRVEMVRILKEVNGSIPSTIYQGEAWMDVLRNTLLNLCPRGFGRTSFRLYEVIQMGLIPVYIHNDHAWIPYRGSPASLMEFGFAVHIRDFQNWLVLIADQYRRDPARLQLNERRAKMLQYRKSHYTYEGILQQIEYFLKGDSRNVLVCEYHPFFSGVHADPGF